MEAAREPGERLAGTSPLNTPAADPNAGSTRSDEPRAPLGSWGRLYALVIVALVLDIVLLAWLTGRFR